MIGDGQDPDEPRWSTTSEPFAAPTVAEQGAVAMVRGGLRHLIVIDEGEAAARLLFRDIVPALDDDGASREVLEPPDWLALSVLVVRPNVNVQG